MGGAFQHVRAARDFALWAASGIARYAMQATQATVEIAGQCVSGLSCVENFTHKKKPPAVVSWTLRIHELQWREKLLEYRARGRCRTRSQQYPAS